MASAGFDAEPRAAARPPQATEGDNTAAKPGMLSTYEATYKWQAWESNKGEGSGQNERLAPVLARPSHRALCRLPHPAGKSKDDAKKAYVDELKAQISEFY